MKIYNSQIYIYCITTGLSDFIKLLSKFGLRDLDLMQVMSVIINHKDDIMIISETEKQARTDFNKVKRHMTNRSWLINPAKR